MAYEKQSDKIEMLTEQVESLVKDLDDMRGAFRRISEQLARNIELLSKLNSTVSALKLGAERVDKVLTNSDLYANGVTKYQ